MKASIPCNMITYMDIGIQTTKLIGYLLINNYVYHQTMKSSHALNIITQILLITIFVLIHELGHSIHITVLLMKVNLVYSKLYYIRTLPPKSLHSPISVYAIKHACYSGLGEGQGEG